MGTAKLVLHVVEALLRCGRIGSRLGKIAGVLLPVAQRPLERVAGQGSANIDVTVGLGEAALERIGVMLQLPDGCQGLLRLGLGLSLVLGVATFRGGNSHGNAAGSQR